ncbi:MAG: flavin reductase family protein [Planctomycetota bacterium]|jgi:flavin reductase (DIM6/NTAB) family NADH-FMN oxidoreductase RutF
MERAKMELFDHYAAVMTALGSGGLLLGSYDAAGKANIMTIGWGTLGIVWGLPIWIVLVRPSRYTYECIEHSQAFTVNVPAADMGQACALAGTESGRDLDKFAETGLTAERSAAVDAPIVIESPIIYECQVVHHNDVLPESLVKDVITGAYPSGDFHRVYFGKVLEAEAATTLPTLLGQS